MKKIKSILIAGIIAMAISSQSQNCTSFYPVDKGTVLELSHYTKKDVFTGKDIQKIISVENTAKGVDIIVENENFDNNSKSQGKRQLKLKCEDGNFYFDVTSYLDPKSMESFKNSELKVTGTNIQMPSSLTVGQTLPDADMSISMADANNPAASMFSMNVKINNRKVEAIEKVTTPAGTFECYKIIFTVETKMMFKTTVKGIEWISKEVGSVRSEVTDSKGSLLSYTVLSSIKK